MKKTEKILLLIAIVGLVLKIFHLPGSSLSIILSLLFLAIIYAHFGFAFFNNISFRLMFRKESYSTVSNKRIIGAIGVGIALSLVVISILFKLMLWPGAFAMQLMGIVFIGIIVIISIVKWKKRGDSYYTSILRRGLIFGGIVIILFLIPSVTWLNWNYPNHPNYVNAVLEAQNDPTNQELWEKVEEERVKMYDQSDD